MCEVQKLCDEYLDAAALAEQYLVLAGEAKSRYEKAENDAYRKTRANATDHSTSFAWKGVVKRTNSGNQNMWATFQEPTGNITKIETAKKYKW